MFKVLIFLLLQQAAAGEAKVSAAWSVTFENPDYCALEGTSVEFKCSYHYPEDESVRETGWCKGLLQNGTWKRVKLSTLLTYKNRFKYQGDHIKNCSLVLQDVQESDAGYYYFWFDTNKFGRSSKQSVLLSVIGSSGLKASIHPRRVNAGDNVILQCSTKCQNPRIVWFRDGRRVTEPTFRAQKEDAGNYSCTVEGIKPLLSSDPVALEVWYAPIKLSIEVNRSNPLLVGSSVNLTCKSVANPAADTYTWWYRSNASNPSSDLQVGLGRVLSISSLELTQTGMYICQAQNHVGQSRSAEVLLTVEDTVHPLIVLGIGIKVIFLLTLPLVIIWAWKHRSCSEEDKEKTSNDYENVMFG
ncbi:B-cell receptor CD22-like isoform X1 [Cyprinodon tularosa]|uniref:B-cell receptor CD22-like isoform X1 n=1 Tax=Cyprinodon tularosa TaxID=77115 RepID=UPI0018E2674D|nr:B-cell receptor CD22-like isoform X1 [Cyprinodon tularosa]